jgi:hypothetical protein
MAWEYLFVQYVNQDMKNNKVVTSNDEFIFICGAFEFLIKKFNELGAHGWECVSMDSGSAFYLFKRAV